MDIQNSVMDRGLDWSGSG